MRIDYRDIIKAREKEAARKAARKAAWAHEIKRLKAEIKQRLIELAWGLVAGLIGGLFLFGCYWLGYCR